MPTVSAKELDRIGGWHRKARGRDASAGYLPIGTGPRRSPSACSAKCRYFSHQNVACNGYVHDALCPALHAPAADLGVRVRPRGLTTACLRFGIGAHDDFRYFFAAVPPGSVVASVFLAPHFQLRRRIGPRSARSAPLFGSCEARSSSSPLLLPSGREFDGMAPRSRFRSLLFQGFQRVARYFEGLQRPLVVHRVYNDGRLFLASITIVGYF